MYLRYVLYYLHARPLITYRRGGERGSALPDQARRPRRANLFRVNYQLLCKVMLLHKDPSFVHCWGSLLRKTNSTAVRLPET